MNEEAIEKLRLSGLLFDSEKEFFSSIDPTDSLVVDRATLRFVDNECVGLNSYECGVVESVTRKLKSGGSISPKQRAIMERIASERLRD